MKIKQNEILYKLLVWFHVLRPKYILKLKHPPFSHKISEAYANRNLDHVIILAVHLGCVWLPLCIGYVWSHCCSFRNNIFIILLQICCCAKIHSCKSYVILPLPVNDITFESYWLHSPPLFFEFIFAMSSG